ncbi:MAG: hypothetical protein ABI687_02380 [Flavitalea sp.]
MTDSLDYLKTNLCNFQVLFDAAITNGSDFEQIKKLYLEIKVLKKAIAEKEGQLKDASPVERLM